MGQKSFRSKEAICERVQRLRQPHILPLAKCVKTLRRRYPDVEFPYFDPADGGVDAEILFLFEKPGRKTIRRYGGSGFISRDNNDETAAAIFRFMNEAGIPRNITIIWNVVPGWNGSRTIRGAELMVGILELQTLLKRLEGCTTIVLVGRKAQRASISISPTVQLFSSFHPSPIVRRTNTEAWLSIPKSWSDAWLATKQGSTTMFGDSDRE